MSFGLRYSFSLACKLSGYIGDDGRTSFNTKNYRVIMDTHQYFLHRLFHLNKTLYKHIHSHHHRLYVPYAFGALYNHPIEGFLLDTLGATISYELTGMSPRLGMLFFTFSNMKTGKSWDIGYWMIQKVDS